MLLVFTQQKQQNSTGPWPIPLQNSLRRSADFQHAFCMAQRLRTLRYNYCATENTLFAALIYVHVCLCILLHIPLFLKLFKDLCKRCAPVTLLELAVLGYFLFLFVYPCFLCSSISPMFFYIFNIKFGTDGFLCSHGNKTEKILGFTVCVYCGLGLKMFLYFFLRESFSISLKLFNVYSWSIGQILFITLTDTK